MKKKISILILGLMIILTSTLTLTVNAADATVTLDPSKTQLNPEDTFKVVLSAAYDEGINGIVGVLSYDEDKLELTKVEIVNTLNWSLFNEPVEEGLNLAVMCNSTSKITNADILEIEFKVKDNANEGTTKISLKDITIDGDTTNSTQQLGTKEIEVSIVEEPVNPNPGETPGGDEGNNPGENPGENPGNNPNETPQEKTLTSIEITKAPTKNTYKVGDKFDKTGMKVVAKYSDGSSKEITNYTIENGDKLTEGQTSVKVSYTEENVTKTVEQKITVVKNVTVEDDKKDDDKSDYKEIKDDNTKTENKMPNTGASSVVGLMAIVAAFGVVCLVKYNKYKDI